MTAQRPLQVAFLYTRESRYSVHALVGAMDTHEVYRRLPLLMGHRPEEIRQKISEVKKEGAIVLCLSFTSARARDMGRLLRDIRADRDASDSGDARLIALAGGSHATAMPEQTLNMGFDLVVAGEGEGVFLELLDRFSADSDWRDVPGIGWRDNEGTFHLNPRPAPISLDDFPCFSHARGHYGHIEITRGCPFACAFCQTSRIQGGKPRHRSIESICRHIEVMRQAGRVDYRFITPNAFGYGSPDGREPRPDMVERLLKAMRETAGPEGRIYFGSFPSEVRPEHVTDENVSWVREYCDNRQLIIGAQSGSASMLEASHRGHSVDDVMKATRCILRNGLGVGVDFIFGLPGETDADREATIRLMFQLAEMGARIHTHTFMPIPGTKWADAPPGKIRPDLLRSLHQLIPRGHAYGNWKEQEIIARQIARMSRENPGT